ncbi:formylmethanofuran dehydrogenase [Desulfovibrio sulfodismutans]|uniref:Formylmethanofuran dehydrogenase n=1 Tax=Desulfolutivibrio sulfodismutans TaxID=63561 RepID=A0A7K3NUI1_9BACT|nr:FmdE family protein [Desulfolutivibrio sulfodismutans]NDY58909.1 formylmethanofuran dehydrogenase [Desulfolutivibrio sulfodismutans]QLA12822.1 formylmethanofuran dehydrogenase [Desulfolutivibrio sulfodismutans DSM 3696]
MGCTLTKDQLDAAVAFHGHECPGLTIGLRAAELCLREFGHNNDTPILAVVETDMCGVDAIQALTGCTYGKGNLIHRDLGKMAFSFYRKTDGKSFRAVLRPESHGEAGNLARSLMKTVFSGQATEEQKRLSAEMREKYRQHLLSLDLAEVFTIGDAPPMPRGAAILDSLVCEHCGESTMESRTRRFGGKTLCIPCFTAVEQKI